MAADCSLKFHGIRAFHPAPGRQNIATGGNTGCLELRDDSSHLFINAGFGINQALPNWAEDHKIKKDKFKSAILFSDLFWDSILGLPFFAPMHFKSSHIELYSCAAIEQTRDAMDDMSSNLVTPFNGIKSFPAKISIQEVAGVFQWGNWTISGLPIKHPLAPYPISVWKISHTSGAELGIVMISNPDEKSLAAIGHFLQGVKTLVCAASNVPWEDSWSKHRTTFDDALKLGLVIRPQDLYLTQFHPVMTDVMLQAELRKLQKQLVSLSTASSSPMKLHLASEVESFISLSSLTRAKAG